MAADLRSFLGLLEERGLLVRIEREVDRATEAARPMRQLELRGLAGLFTSIAGADASLVYNLIGTRAALALAFGVEPAEVRGRFRHALEHRLEPVASTTRRYRRSCSRGRRGSRRVRRHPFGEARGPYVTAGW